MISSDSFPARRLDSEQAQAQLELKDRARAATAAGITIADLSLPDNPLIYANEGFERLTAIRWPKSSDEIAAFSGPAMECSFHGTCFSTPNDISSQAAFGFLGTSPFGLAYRGDRGGNMKYRAVALAIGLAIWALAQSENQTPATGTWKLSLDKSKYNPGPPPTIPAILRIEAVEGGERISVDGVGADGKAASWSYTATYDGKPTTVSGSPYGDTVVLKKSGPQTTTITYTRSGKVSRTSTRTVSKDGKTLTITAKGTNANGQQYNNTTVFEKQ